MWCINTSVLSAASSPNGLAFNSEIGVCQVWCGEERHSSTIRQYTELKRYITRTCSSQV